MNSLKPWICEWLHNVRKELKSKKTMILKGWEKTRFTRVGSGDFQLATMEANTTYGATCVFLELFKWWISLILDDGFSNVGRGVLPLLML
jgi:hypothetical protein